MIYFIGIGGFFFGFFAGQALLLQLLKKKTRDELLSNKSLRFKYGLLNWGMAIAGCYGAIQIAKHYFGL